MKIIHSISDLIPTKIILNHYTVINEILFQGYYLDDVNDKDLPISDCINKKSAVGMWHINLKK